MDLRMRLFTRALDASRSLAAEKHTEAGRERARRPLPHNRLVDLVAGRVPDDVTVTDETLDLRSGRRAVRVYRPTQAPPGPLPAVVNYHGGGWVLGNLRQCDWLCAEVASQVPCVVVSVDYRLAPEHPYPAAREDCRDAFDAVVAEADRLGVRADEVSVMGDSAGGNLAAVVALQVRDRRREGSGDVPKQGPSVHRQVLIYPAVDLTTSSPSHGLLPDAPVLPRPARDAFLDLYLQGRPADPDDPYQSPLRAEDHADLPPALVLCAELDPLTAEGRAYAGALHAAGVAVRYVEHVRMPHGFVSFPGVSRAAPQALADVVGFLRGDVPAVGRAPRHAGATASSGGGVSPSTPVTAAGR